MTNSTPFRTTIDEPSFCVECFQPGALTSSDGRRLTKTLPSADEVPIVGRVCVGFEVGYSQECPQVDSGRLDAEPIAGNPSDER